MNTFTKGVLVGLGVGLLIAPMTGEEMRKLMNERFTVLRDSLPENTNAYMQQIGARVAQTGGNLRDYAQQAVSKMKDTSSTLGDLVQQSAQEMKQTSQDIADTTKATVSSVKANGLLDKAE